MSKEAKYESTKLVWEEGTCRFDGNRFLIMEREDRAGKVFGPAWRPRALLSGRQGKLHRLDRRAGRL